MIDWTYSHFRVFMRLLAPKALLYTEMLTTGAILNHPQKALAFDTIEHPLAIQLGGYHLDELVQSAILAEQAGFDEINLNLGCPSDRVQSGRFGACLMAEGQHVADCLSAMKKAIRIPVTAKTRIGIDNQDSYAFFSTFVRQLMDAGCDKLIVHARKAWLNGLNPKQNRTIPPLHYDYVYKIKQEWLHIPVILNGHVLSTAQAKEHLTYVDGVMIGRLACQHPYAIAAIHHALFPEVKLPKRSDVLQQYWTYLEPTVTKARSISLLLKPILNLAHGLPGAKAWKQQVLQLTQANFSSESMNVLDALNKIETPT